MNPKSQALKRRTTDATGLRKVADFVMGKRRVDNTANPASAYSMSKRKQQNTLPRPLQK